MTLLDTSAWVEYLRSTGSAVHHEVKRLIDRSQRVETTDVVVMELLAGARDAAHEQHLRRLLGACTHLPVEGLGDYEEAATVYRRCRRAGETVRALTDCLVAVVALRHRVDVLHADRDFDALARHTDLQLHS